ncbi:MAG: hypothetical protein ABJB17_02235 [Burkholderiales bacterium]
MDQIIVYVDEADHARQQIGPLRSTGAGHDAALSAQSTPATATHWIVVACPPKLPRDASKWVSAESVEGWRQDWASELFDELRPLFNAPGDKLTCVLATGELVKLTDTLIAEHGNARVLDARCPKYGVDLAPVSKDQKPPSSGWKWQIPAALAGLGALLVLGAE